MSERTYTRESVLIAGAPVSRCYFIFLLPASLYLKCIAFHIRLPIRQCKIWVSWKCQTTRVCVGTQPWTVEQKHLLSTLHLLSTKPMAYILNVDEGSAVDGNALTRAVQQALGPSANSIILSVSLECQASTLGTAGHLEYLQLAGLEYTGLERVVRTCATLLGQGYFYTVGKDECRFWTINKNSTAQQAAGAIHSDIEKGFIKAEVMTPDALISCGSEEAVKAKNLMRIEGKEYIVKDGDCMNFKFTERK